MNAQLTEIGEELIQLISETASNTGLSVSAIASAVSNAAGVDFIVKDGKLNITEEALLAVGERMAYARAKCRALELPHIPPPLPTKSPPKPKPTVSTMDKPSGWLGCRCGWRGYPDNVAEEKITGYVGIGNGHGGVFMRPLTSLDFYSACPECGRRLYDPRREKAKREAELQTEKEWGIAIVVIFLVVSGLVLFAAVTTK